ncbi:MAG: hypothetical protein COU27_02490 [Candidatus Levybacteria bacterium CG10_big_fil_rev_8_21_14_0_10_36_7]|nr:MAG: hypothetical protein COU27_02490 [Candidatus Levybacteria bacterium CG10_big_fil_rev_8_21_14_0_10_36_7]
MQTPKEIPEIRIITISGRIASGSTTLAKLLAQKLNWRHIEGGEIFWEAIRKKMNLQGKDTDLRPDSEDVLFDRQLKKILNDDSGIVLETKLAGFNAQRIPNVFKILAICNDENGQDQTQIRIDRFVNREGVSVETAKEEILEREENDLEKWRKLYADNDPHWTYYDEKYYDLIINSFNHNKEGVLGLVLEKLGIS